MCLSPVWYLSLWICVSLLSQRCLKDAAFVGRMTSCFKLPCVSPDFVSSTSFRWRKSRLLVFSRACQGNFAMLSCLVSVFQYLHTWMIILFRWKMTLNSLGDIPFSAAIHTCWRKGRLNHYPPKNSIMNPPPLLRKVWNIVFLYFTVGLATSPSMLQKWSAWSWRRRLSRCQPMRMPVTNPISFLSSKCTLLYLDWSSFSSTVVYVVQWHEVKTLMRHWTF